MPRDPVLDRYRNRLGGLARRLGPDAPEVLAARRDLHVARIQRDIRELCESEPGPTAEQLGELVAQLTRGRRSTAA